MASPNTRIEATEQMYAAVGRAITRWGFVEEQLYQIFALCLGNVLPIKGEGDPMYMLDSWEGMWVFYSLETFFSKRTILDAAVTAYLYGTSQEEEFLEEWGKLSQKSRELAMKRNKLAHWTVLPAQIDGTPARLMPTIGSPKYWRETGRNPPGKSLTRIQVGHIDTAFCLFEKKLLAFARKLRDSQELRDKDFQKALRLLLSSRKLSPSAQEELAQLLASSR